MRALIILASAAALVSCGGGGEHGDLRRELAEMTKGIRGHVKPLPKVKEYTPVPYDAEKLVDPFRPDRIVVAQDKGAGGGRGTLAPDESRPKEPLEAFALESIQMVGTLTQKTETFALVKAGQSLYRVKKGNYMGQNFGVITGIDDYQISLKELVQDGTGEWTERVSALQLQEGPKK